MENMGFREREKKGNYREMEERLKDMAEEYVRSGELSDDFWGMKGKERVSCFLRLLPYFVEKKEVGGEKSKGIRVVQMPIDFIEFDD